MTRPAESMYNMRMARRLVKSRDKKLFGVAGGVAEYFDIDPTIVRVGFAVLCFVLSPLVLIAYGGLAILIPSPATEQPQIDQESTPVEDSPVQRHNLFAWALIGIGVFIVFSRLDFPSLGNGWLLPVVLVGLGTALLSRRSRLN